MKREAREQEAGTGRPPAAMLTGWSRAARSRRAPGGLGGTQLRAELRDPPTPRSPVLGSGGLRVGAGEGVQGSGAHCRGRAEQRTPKPKPPPRVLPTGPRCPRAAGAAPRGWMGTPPHGSPLPPLPGPRPRRPLPAAEAGRGRSGAPTASPRVGSTGEGGQTPAASAGSKFIAFVKNAPLETGLGKGCGRGCGSLGSGCPRAPPAPRAGAGRRK